MKFLTLFFTLISIVLSSGCSTGITDEAVMGKPESYLWHNSASIQTKITYFKRTCNAYGITDGTPQMVSCLQKEMRNSKNRAQSKMNTNNARSLRCTSYGNITNCY